MSKISIILILFVIMALNFPAFAHQTNEVKCDGGVAGASAETKNYYVNICGYGKFVFVFHLTKKMYCQLKMEILNTY
jgi:hypothetical protein